MSRVVQLTKAELRSERDVSYMFLPNQSFDKHTETQVIQKFKVICLHCLNIYQYNAMSMHIVTCPCNPSSCKSAPATIITCDCGGKYNTADGISVCNHMKNRRHINPELHHIKVMPANSAPCKTPVNYPACF